MWLALEADITPARKKVTSPERQRRATAASPPPGSTQSRLLTFSMSSRARRNPEVAMDILYRCCAGLDVHKKTVVACVRRRDAGGQTRPEAPPFGTGTCPLLASS